MINKEKLLNGYVKTDNKELVRLFLIECLKHDDIKLPYISDKTFMEWERFAVADTGTPCGHTRKSISGKEELTLDDFKPKTKVTYELVTDMTNNEIAKAMINGEVFYDKYGIDYYQWSGSRFINNKGLTASCDGEFYRKVEKEIDWKGEAINYVDGCKHLDLHTKLRTIFADAFDEEDREFDSEALELCRVILRATGELK